MSITDGQQALIRRIVEMPAAPNIIQPDPTAQGANKDLPRYVIQVAGGAQRTATLKGTTIAEPEITVRVETKAQDYGRTNKQMVDALVALFAVTSRFDGVTILDAPSVRPPLPVTDGVYTVPVVIRGRYYF